MPSYLAVMLNMADSTTVNPKLEGEGLGEKIAGKVQKKVGQFEKVLEK